MPKVSVIIPTYNVEKYLSDCLNSILNQTFEDIEIICIDDGSTDSTLKILNEYSSKDNRIKILTQENAGPGVARTKGIAVAQGEYLSFIDSDDYISLDYYEKLYTKAQKTNADIVKAGWVTKETNGKEIIGTRNIEIAKELEKYSSPYSTFYNEWQSAIFKRSLVNQYGINFPSQRYHEDVAFLYKFLSITKTFAIEDSAFYTIRKNLDSTTNKKVDISRYKCFLNARLDVLLFINKYINDEAIYDVIYRSKVFGAVFYDLKRAANDKNLSRKDFHELCNLGYKIIITDNSSFDKNNKNFKLLKSKQYDLLKLILSNLQEKFFSIKNEIKGSKKRKVINILGIKIKFRRR